MHVLIFICITSAVVQIIFSLQHIKAAFIVTKHAPLLSSPELPTVSIIICAKDERLHLPNLFAQLNALSYPKHLLEIILVDDQSTDDTGSLMHNFAVGSKAVRVIQIEKELEKDLPGKKYALKAGIEAATHEWLLLTDADCRPIHADWIQCMVSTAKHLDAIAVVGYGAYDQRDSILNQFIQFETLHTAIQYMTAAIQGMAYMGVGRNMLYQSQVAKEIFEDNHFLNLMRQTSSGDDDLLIQQLLKHGKICPVTDPRSFTISDVVNTWTEFFHQKSRHTSASKYYNLMSKLKLGLYALSHAVFWSLSLIIIFYFAIDAAADQTYYYLFIGCWFTAMMMKLMQYQLWKRILHHRNLLLSLLSFDFFWMIYNVILSPYIFWKNKQQWK